MILDKEKPNSIKASCLKHNFWTWSAQAEIEPIEVTRAQGVYFWDAQDKRYLDFNSMVMCSNIGHGNQRVIEAMHQQAMTLTFAGPWAATAPRAQLGELLADITPENINRFLFTLGGADANENAIKLARGYSGKNKILAHYRSYHGSTHGAVALTGDLRRSVWEPNVMPGVIHVLNPYAYRSPFIFKNEAELTLEHLNYLEEVIRCEDAKTIAAIILEPVTGTNGIIIPPTGYLQGVREICNRNHILLIADEVMTGFGRTGEWFAVQHWQVKPDIITMAKGLTSGYAPLGAVGMTDEVAAVFDHRVYQGGLTYNGHPVCLAAAIANIEVIRDEDLVARAKNTGLILNEMLEELKTHHPSVGEIRSIGLFGAIELVRNRKSREPLSPYGGKSAEMKKLKQEFLERGLFLTIHDNVLLIIPPLIVNQQELANGFSIISDSLAKVEKEL